MYLWFTCLSVGVGVSLSILIYWSSISPFTSSRAAQTFPRTKGGMSMAASLFKIEAVYGYPWKTNQQKHIHIHYICKMHIP